MATAATTAASKECCLCGDVGFSSDLLLCPICGFRLQHIYCSSSYPNVDPKEWRCEWCVHDQEQRRLSHGHKLSKAVAAAVEVQSDGDGASSGEETKTVIRFTRKRPRSDGVGDVEKPTLRVDTSAGTKTSKVKTRGWRRLRHCSSASTRVMGRRYKLLADVLWRRRLWEFGIFMLPRHPYN